VLQIVFREASGDQLAHALLRDAGAFSQRSAGVARARLQVTPPRTSPVRDDGICLRMNRAFAPLSLSLPFSSSLLFFHIICFDAFCFVSTSFPVSPCFFLPR
jgi:hypothetical protein